MKNIKALALALLLTLSGSSYALADFAVGIAGGIADIDASGTETEGGEKTNGSVSNQAGVVSVFAEYSPEMVSGLTIGLDYIPGKADVSNKIKSRTDAESSITGTATEGSTVRKQTAQAEVSDHITLYASYDVNDTVYVKGGVVQVDLNTLESLQTGSKYGNETVNGVLLGIGIESDIGASSFGRFEISHTMYEDTKFTSSVTRTDVSTANTVDVELDVTMVKAAIGYRF